MRRAISALTLVFAACAAAPTPATGPRDHDPAAQRAIATPGARANVQSAASGSPTNAKPPSTTSAGTSASPKGAPAPGNVGPGPSSKGSASASSSAANSAACPSAMQLVDGEYCTDVDQKCLKS